MRFLMMYRPDQKEGTPPSPEYVAEMGKHCEEAAKAGVLLMSEGLQPTAKGARVRLKGEKFMVTDGPFTEAKDVIAGIAMIQAKSKQEAIELAKNFIKVGGEGETEVRQLYEPSDFGS